MSIKDKQLVSEPHLLAGQLSAPTTGSGIGSVFALNIGGGAVELAFADESGNVTQITNGAALNISGLSHSSLANLSADDHAQYLNNTRGDARYFPQTSFINSSAGVADAGKPVKLNSAGKIDSTMIVSSGGSVNEFTFNLIAGATMGARIAGATNVPSGWTLNTADLAGVGEMGSLNTTLVIIHGLTKIAQEITVFEVTSSGLPVSQGIAKINLTSPGTQKTAVNKNSCGIIDVQSMTDSGKALVVFVKLI